MRWFEKIVAAHTAVTREVSHGEHMPSERYFVWDEDGVNDLTAGNRHVERAVTGHTSLYTKREFDPWADEIEAAFDAAGIAWAKTLTDYEPDTGFRHHDWDWVVTDDGTSDD